MFNKIDSFELSPQISKSKLEKYGFTTYNGNTYTYTKKLFKDIIFIHITVYLKDMEVEYEVCDGSVKKSYLPFYNNTNGANNLVAEKVIENFNKLILDLSANEIIALEGIVKWSLLE